LEGTGQLEGVIMRTRRTGRTRSDRRAGSSIREQPLKGTGTFSNLNEYTIQAFLSNRVRLVR